MTFKASKKAVYIAAESTYGVDPSATGSGYVSIPAMEISEINDKRNLLPTNYQTGRGYGTAGIPGPDGAEFSITVPLIGLRDAALATEAPPSVDWLDLILTHIFGTVATQNGVALSSVASMPTNFTTGATTFAVQHLMPVFDAINPTAAPRTWWGLVTSGAAGVHVISPMPAALNIQGAALGTRNFRFADDGGASVSFVYVSDNIQYTLSGCRVTAAKITAEAGQMAKLALTIGCDSRTVTSKASLPAVLAAPVVTPVRCAVSPVYFNGTEIVTKSIDLDFGLNATEVMAVAGVNGRGEWQNATLPQPTLTIQPLRTQANLDLKHAATTGQLILQFGRGWLGVGTMPGALAAVNTLACAWAGVVAEDVQQLDDGGHLRQTIKFTMADPVVAGAVAAVPFQLSRA